MSNIDIGNTINEITITTQNYLFGQGELAQLSFNAFNHAVSLINNTDEEEVTLSYPVGYKPDKTPILSDHTYKKEELIQKYQFLAEPFAKPKNPVNLLT